MKDFHCLAIVFALFAIAFAILHYDVATLIVGITAATYALVAMFFKEKN